jgi:hypothetical protein
VGVVGVVGENDSATHRRKTLRNGVCCGAVHIFHINKSQNGQKHEGQPGDSARHWPRALNWAVSAAILVSSRPTGT